MCAKFDDVPGVTRFDGTEDVHRGNVSAAEGALVHDLFDARAGGGDLAGEIGETARPIADHGGEAAEPAIGDEAALVHDLFDARAGGGDLAGEIGETARPIADHGGEAAEPAIGDEAALNHAAEDVWVDVAAAKQEHAVFAGELFQFVRHHRGERRSGSTFDDGFLEFNKPENRERDLFLTSGG